MILAPLLGLGGLLGISLGIYPYYIEPIWLKTKVVPITISRDEQAPQGKTLRLVHVSDFHWGAFVSHRYLTRAFHTIAEQHPDAILITGDFVNWRIEDRENYVKGLKVLTEAAPVFAVGGNHDGGLWAGSKGGYVATDSIRILLTSAGIHYLENTFECPELRGLRVCVGGVGDLWAGYNHPEAFAGAYDSTPAALKIMLIHNPDAKYFVRNDKWDLLLAGHTHGGQVDLPFIGAPWVEVEDKSEVRGLFTYQGKPFYINPGVGSSQRRARLFCRPEVSVLKVTL